MGRKLDDFCPVKDCRGRPTMPFQYLDDYAEKHTTVICQIHWEEFQKTRSRLMGPPHKSVFKEGIQIRNI
jgi:nitrite reductase/ring-hydroxylating ferredoxin subunit